MLLACLLASYGNSLSVVYPYGSSLSISSPAVPILSSGDLSFPQRRAIGAVSRVGGGGMLIVFGSSAMFDDQYLVKEDNWALLNGLIKLMESPVDISPVDEDTPEIQPSTEAPDVGALSERLQCCLQESEPLPTDFTTLFDESLFKYNTDMIPEVLALFEKLKVKHESLNLIPPQFEVPLPDLKPAVFIPEMRSLPLPSLELFDLDESFATDRSKLAQLTNQCSPTDLDFFVKKAGAIIGVNDSL
eukprot:764744_1